MVVDVACQQLQLGAELTLKGEQMEKEGVGRCTGASRQSGRDR